MRLTFMNTLNRFIKIGSFSGYSTKDYAILFEDPTFIAFFTYRDRKKVSSIRRPMLVLRRLERTETNLIHLKWGSV